MLLTVAVAVSVVAPVEQACWLLVTATLMVVPAGDITADVAAPEQPAALCALTVCVLLAANADHDVAAPYAPPSRLNSRPVVTLLTLSVPETDPHVEGVLASTGTDGDDGSIAIAIPVAALIQPAVFCWLTVWLLPATSLLQDDMEEYAPPSKLNINPAVVLLTLMLPVDTVQVGSDFNNAGAEGAGTSAPMATDVFALMQP